MVGLIGFACGCEAFQAFLRRFSGDFGRFWTDFARFCRFRGLGNPLKPPRVPSYGVREARGMHVCRPGPWARPGGGMGLQIARLYIAKLNNIAFISNHKVWSIHARVHSRAALRSRQEMAGELPALDE